MSARTHLAAVVALFGAGCGLTIGAYEPMIENRCSADSECSGAACDPTLGMCVSSGTPVLRIGLEITPSVGAGSMPTTFSFSPIELSGPTRRDFGLPATINVIGNVRAPGGDESVQADVHFVRPGAFAGARALDVETTTVATPVIAADGTAADYAVHVAADEDYDVIIEPTGDWTNRLPPLHLSRHVSGGGDFIRLPSFTYPADMPELRGIITDVGETPVDGLIVKAVEPVTGRVLSSTAVTGASEGTAPGEFHVLLDPTATSYVIRIAGGDTRPTFPTILADPAYFFPDESGFAHILVPTLTPIDYAGHVEYADTVQPAAGAVVTFRATQIFDADTGFTGTFRTTVTADEHGDYSATLVPGTYDVVVTPPAERDQSNYGVYLEPALQIDMPADGAVIGQLFQLPVRAHLGGTVRTSDERVMGGAMVSASALGTVPEGVDPVARHNRTSEATTDPLGQFNLALDVGVYDIYVKPPSGSRFPWVVRPGYTFGASTSTYSDVFEVTAPIPLSGTIASDGSVAANAEIRAYAIVDDGAGGERAVLVGSTSTAEDGTFMLLLPARLAH